jgi:hypothetical protein
MGLTVPSRRRGNPGLEPTRLDQRRHSRYSTEKAQKCYVMTPHIIRLLASAIITHPRSNDGRRKRVQTEFQILTQEYISTKLGWRSPPQNTQVSGSFPPLFCSQPSLPLGAAPRFACCTPSLNLPNLREGGRCCEAWKNSSSHGHMS